MIVGDGPLMGELTEVARAEGVTDRIWFAGSRDDVAQVLAGLDAFALPSLAEGISNTLLEAMATGAARRRHAGGGKHRTRDRKTSMACSCRPATRRRSTGAMLGYLTDPALARRHGVAARATVEARYSLDRMVADYAALYEAVAHRRAARGLAESDINAARAGPRESLIMLNPHAHFVRCPQRGPRTAAPCRPAPAWTGRGGVASRNAAACKASLPFGRPGGH